MLFDNLRNAHVRAGRPGRDAAAGRNAFRHLHDLSLRFHLERRTGAVTKIVERGTKSIDMMLYFLLFNIAPTIVELAIDLHHLLGQVRLGPGRRDAFMVVALHQLHPLDHRLADQAAREMNDLDTGAVARAVDSLLNYETVKYFGAEEREAARYGEAVRAYAEAAVRNETSLAWLNIGQSLITNLMMAGAMGFVVWGWSRGPLHHRRRGRSSTPCSPSSSARSTCSAWSTAPSARA